MKSLVESNKLFVGALISAVILLGVTTGFTTTTTLAKVEVLDRVNMVIDMDHFNQLEIGMSHAQLEVILGAPTLFFHYVPDENSDVYVWEFKGYSGKESYAVTVKNDRVVSTHYCGKNFDVSYGSDLSVDDVVEIAHGLQHYRFQGLETAVARDAQGVPHPPKSAFEMIEFDMRYSVVIDMLGTPRMQTCAEPCKKYVWNVEDATISVKFVDGKVKLKKLKTKDFGVSLSFAPIS